MALYQLICEKGDGWRVISGTIVSSPMEPENLRRLARSLNKRFPHRKYYIAMLGREAWTLSDVPGAYSPVDFRGVGYGEN